jgi:hypothetical protein
MSSTPSPTQIVAPVAPVAPVASAEESKGYWTEGSSGYLDIAVIEVYDVAIKSSSESENSSTTTLGGASDVDTPLIKSSAILLSSGYWYRVQHFELTDGTAWSWLKTLLRECGRKLPEPLGGAENDINVVYRIGNLSLQQVNQMYYLLKHSLTSAKVPFTLAHSLTMTAGTVAAPKPKKAHRRLRRNKNRQIIVEPNFNWKIVK